MQKERVFIGPDGLRANYQVARLLKDAEGIEHPFGLSDEQLAALGYRYVEVQVQPDDYSEVLYYRDEPQEDPYIVYTKKSPEQIYQAQYSTALASRKAAYVSESDPLMYDYLRGEVTKEVWLAVVQAIKERFPFPVEVQNGESIQPSGT